MSSKFAELFSLFKTAMLFMIVKILFYDSDH